MNRDDTLSILSPALDKGNKELIREREGRMTGKTGEIGE